MSRRVERVHAEFERARFARDLKYMIWLEDQRRAANAAARSACKADANLCAMLLADAQRRGQTEIDWPEYFRNIDINYP